jgi:hypothetical protein
MPDGHDRERRRGFGPSALMPSEPIAAADDAVLQGLEQPHDLLVIVVVTCAAGE